MLTTSSAPAAAWALTGPVGSQASSQTETPDVRAGDQVQALGPGPGREVALLIEHRVIGQVTFVVNTADLAAGANGRGVIEVEALVDEADDGGAIVP